MYQDNSKNKSKKPKFPISVVNDTKQKGATYRWCTWHRIFVSIWCREAFTRFLFKYWVAFFGEKLINHPFQRNGWKWSTQKRKNKNQPKGLWMKAAGAAFLPFVLLSILTPFYPPPPPPPPSLLPCHARPFLIWHEDGDDDDVICTVVIYSFEWNPILCLCQQPNLLNDTVRLISSCCEHEINYLKKKE